MKTETDNLVNRYQKLARIPGFRKGKVPASIVRQRFAEEIKSDVVDALVPRYFREEAKKQNLAPVSQPRVTDLHIHEGEPLRFKASFEVLPEFKVAPYDDIRVTTIDTNVTDEDVENALNNLRDQHATYTAVEEDRPLADGDFAVAGFKGTPKEASRCRLQAGRGGRDHGRDRRREHDSRVHRESARRQSRRDSAPSMSSTLTISPTSDWPARSMTYEVKC